MTASHLSVQAPPAAALGLGYAGLLPFVAGAAATWMLAGEARLQAAFWLAAYAAVIVSFLGGIVIPPGDSEALAMAVLALASDRAFARELGAAGRREAVARHSWRARAQATDAVLRRVTSGGGD